MVLLNGKASETANLQDRGLMYGDGLFETIAVRDQRLEFWQRHLERLRKDCERLKIPPPDPHLLLGEARQLCHGRANAVLKIIITRGEGGRGYRAPAATQTHPSRILACYEWPDYPQEIYGKGVTLRICDTKLGINPSLAGMKHLNRLEQVLARSEWDDISIFEGLMLDCDGHVIEGTMSNLFIVKDGALFTPDLSQAGVTGIMRNLIQDIAHDQAIPVQTACFDVEELGNAEELFICNSLIGVLPVHQLEQWHYSIGPITQAISAALDTARLTDKSHETL